MNQWGTVCDSGWSIIDALVVCRQLGYTTAVDAPVRASFGPGRGPIWLGGVACSGSEANISQCDHVGLAATFCKHDKDAGAVCASEEHTWKHYTTFCNDYSSFIHILLIQRGLCEFDHFSVV